MTDIANRIIKLIIYLFSILYNVGLSFPNKVLQIGNNKSTELSFHGICYLVVVVFLNAIQQGKYYD